MPPVLLWLTAAASDMERPRGRRDAVHGSRRADRAGLPRYLCDRLRDRPSGRPHIGSCAGSYGGPHIALYAALYAAGLAVAVLQTVFPVLTVDGNVLPALLGTAVVIAALRRGNRRARRCGVAAYALWQFAGAAAVAQLPSPAPVPHAVLRAALGLVPGGGYGLGFVALGVAFWLCRDSRMHLTVTFALGTLIDMMIHDGTYGALLLGWPASMMGWLGTEDQASETLYRALFADPLMQSPVGVAPGPFGWSIAWTMILALPFLLALGRFDRFDHSDRTASSDRADRIGRIEHRDRIEHPYRADRR
ncbi:hypothetical protein G1C96_1576 [Bifidobacterium sp. DSM 109958]|uniref:Uncharacterized protein n=2 Tax=Bifidobacterium moraviense TaxID=2675323 RepID=A0A7Y0F338_9BIFI|nr:hypothetical protein [Bifidobacterium sp. DSM 109958]